MKIIISPAKKMVTDTDNLEVRGTPVFEKKAKEICKKLQKKSFLMLRELWKCNEKIAEENIKRIKEMNFEKALTPAILSYVGLQYQHLSALTMTREQLEYLDENLRILSGFYGILRPFDGILPYRLEMQAKLKIGSNRNLYEYWNNLIYGELIKENRLIINLASKEYSKVIEPYIQDPVRMITISFLEEQNGKRTQKGTLAKMARGEMVKFLAESQIQEEHKIKEFLWKDFAFDSLHSTEKEYIFVKCNSQNRI